MGGGELGGRRPLGDHAARSTRSPIPDQPQFKVHPAHLVQAPPGTDPPGVSGGVRKDIAAVSAYQITEHTGTQIDFPPHFIPPPGVNVQRRRAAAPRAATPATSSPSPRSWARPWSSTCAPCSPATTRRARAQQVHADWIERWEARYGRVQPGDVPLPVLRLHRSLLQALPRGQPDEGPDAVEAAGREVEAGVGGAGAERPPAAGPSAA